MNTSTPPVLPAPDEYAAVADDLAAIAKLIRGTARIKSDEERLARLSTAARDLRGPQNVLADLVGLAAVPVADAAYGARRRFAATYGVSGQIMTKWVGRGRKVAADRAGKGKG